MIKHPTRSGLNAYLWMGMISSISIRDPDVWNKTKKGALAAGGFTLNLLNDLAKGFIKKKIEDSTGIML